MQVCTICYISLLLDIILLSTMHALGLCPSICDCDDVTLSVRCNHAHFEVIPITLHPELKVMDVGDNNIRSLRDSLGVYKDLMSLNLTSNQLQTIEDSTFLNQRLLQTLLLRRNNLQQLEDGCFRGLEALEVLDMRNNLISELTDGIFEDLTSLRTLDVSDNFLTSLGKDSFSGLRSLRHLLLRGNLMDRVPTEALKRVPQVGLVDMGMNSMEEVQENAFLSLHNIAELSLDGCHISVINRHAFRLLTTLVKLDLKDNNLIEIPSRALFDLVRLEQLDLSGNLFTEVRPMTFQRLRYLKVIKINRCPRLRTIHKHAFAENVNLETVYIEHNHNLRRIQAEAFSEVRYLKKLSLSSNALEVIDADTVSWSRITSLDLSGNPIYCNCSVQWVWRELNDRRSNSTLWKLQTFNATSCAGPETLKGKVLVDLSNAEFNCHDLWSERVTVLCLSAFLLFVLAMGFLVTSRRNGSRDQQYDIRWSGRTHYNISEDETSLRNKLLIVSEDDSFADFKSSS